MGSKGWNSEIIHELAASRLAATRSGVKSWCAKCGNGLAAESALFDPSFLFPGGSASIYNWHHNSIIAYSYIKANPSLDHN